MYISDLSFFHVRQLASDHFAQPLKKLYGDIHATGQLTYLALFLFIKHSVLMQIGYTKRNNLRTHQGLYIIKVLKIVWF